MRLSMLGSRFLEKLNRIATWPRTSINKHTPKAGEIRCPDKYLRTNFAAALFPTSKGWKGPKCPSAANGYQRVGRPRSGILRSHKKERSSDTQNNAAKQDSKRKEPDTKGHALWTPCT